MNRETNPFGDEYMNPFANASGTDSKSRLPVIASKPLSFSRKNDATIDIPLNSINDAKKKEKEIAEREAELRRREQDIKRREDALTRAGIPTEDKNWPPFFPIIHHDIPKDIPLHAQKLQYLAFASWLGIIACLVWNFLAVFFCSVRGGGIKIFFLATIYAMLGCPLSFVLWYRPLYNAMRTDSALNFGWFFLSYMLHVCFCVLAAIAPPIIFEGMSLVGILAAFDAFTDHVMVGILYLIGCIFFCVESLLSILVLQKVYTYFRGQK